MKSYRPRLSLINISLLLAACLGWTAPAFAQYGQPAKFPKTGRTNTDFVPKGWGVALTAMGGDLNGDKLPDEVFIVDHNEDPDMPSEVEYDRVLFVLFSKPDGSYSFGGKAEDVVLCATCDGGLEPVQSLKIERGAIVIEQVSKTGPQAAARLTLRFRYQDGDFFLIGKTLTKPGYKADYNLSTGQKIVEENGKTTKIQAKLPLPRMSNVISRVEVVGF